MRKSILFVILILLIVPISVYADNMYKVDMDIYIDQFGNASITEIWDVKATSGSEWYKQLFNLGNSEISDFIVYMDGRELTHKNWNVDETLEEKAGYYGINYTRNGLELCFGKNDMRRHTFTLKYNLSNYIFNTEDSQVLYWTLLPNVTLDNFFVDITSYYDFPDTLDVWGYGYKGYTYVQDGKISMSNDGKLNNEYVTLLVKFPQNTFNINNKATDYDNFNEVYEHAEEGSFEYNYENKINFFQRILNIIFDLVFSFLPIIIFFFSIKKIMTTGYGYKNNKKIKKKEVPFYRDIPCNKDIYYANALIELNNFGYKNSNILGAILLKWIKTDKIKFKNIETGKFNKKTSIIDLTNESSFDNELEEKLFKMMKKASKDGLLEAKELEKWSKKHYSEFLGLFNRIKNETIDNLKREGHIYKRTNKKECKYENIMNDKIYNDSIQLYGLKKYLNEFSQIGTKEVMEVKLWDEYLMFAYLFGIADKVAKQLKNMYPEIINQQDANIDLFDYNMLLFIDNISTRSVSAASNAKSAAQSYSGGGGGFSSGGGGGGSFGGGGSMGGR